MSAVTPDLPEFTPREDVAASFVRRGEQDGGHRFDPTLHVQGAWNDHEQRLAASADLLVHAIEQHEPREGMQLAKVTFDVYGFIPLRPTLVRVRTVRPGRTIALVEAEFFVDERLIIVARARQLSVQDSSPIAGGDIPLMPALADCTPVNMGEIWPGGFIRSVERYDAPGQKPGRTRTWLRTVLPVVEGKEPSALTRFLCVMDGANGIAVRADPREWMFPHVDLTVHLFRRPDGDATGATQPSPWATQASGSR